MTTEKAVGAFLEGFKEKMRIWDVLFRDDRGKNTQTLVDLELQPIDRKTIKKNQIYIKITLGTFGASVICISFHLAEHQMKNPLKN